MDEEPMRADSSSESAIADARWLVAAVRLATENVAEGGGPFGALIVRGGRQIAIGQNRVTRDNDPTAHAEVQAIRAACAAIGGFSLAGSTLYTSCEPCPLCAAAALWARLDRVVFAADRNDAARAGFDDRAFYDLLTKDPATWPTPVEAAPIPGAFEPFAAWIDNGARTRY